VGVGRGVAGCSGGMVGLAADARQPESMKAIQHRMISRFMMRSFRVLDPLLAIILTAGKCRTRIRMPQFSGL